MFDYFYFVLFFSYESLLLMVGKHWLTSLFQIPDLLLTIRGLLLNPVICNLSIYPCIEACCHKALLDICALHQKFML